MTTLNVKEMSCGHCVERIGKALDEAGIKHSIDLETKTVTVDGCENCVKTAIAELDDIGFTATVA
ncbi:MAG: heavy-metal-associated domain-containing protein [Lachnospiraceae bacterium]|nr:heavy-metal-associated domain-containing protein [Lachnospiraceae bacterium]